MSSSGTDDIFATTRWTVVLTAGKASPQAEIALEELCAVYWFPLYAYVRRHGHTREDAEDLTQAFFVRFLAGNYLDGLSAERGKFRAFLLVALKHFLANEWDKNQRLKRGGSAIHLSLDWQTADTQFQIADSKIDSPDQAFDREWAVALLGQVIERLHLECEAENRGLQFAELKSFLTASNPARTYSAAAEVLGQEESTVRVAVHRLRKRYRQLLRSEIAQTLSDPTQVDEEMRTLFLAF